MSPNFDLIDESQMNVYWLIILDQGQRSTGGTLGKHGDFHWSI